MNVAVKHDVTLLKAQINKLSGDQGVDTSVSQAIDWYINIKLSNETAAERQLRHGRETMLIYRETLELLGSVEVF